jgi:hypothetical protein
VIERDALLEAHLVDVACRAACVSDDAGLSAFADARAWPGGVRRNLDAIRETQEELADACNYLRWGIQRIYALVEAGEPEALDAYSQMMGALSALVVCWHALHRVPS